MTVKLIFVVITPWGPPWGNTNKGGFSSLEVSLGFIKITSKLLLSGTGWMIDQVTFDKIGLTT